MVEQSLFHEVKLLPVATTLKLQHPPDGRNEAVLRLRRLALRIERCPEELLLDFLKALRVKGQQLVVHPRHVLAKLRAGLLHLAKVIFALQDVGVFLPNVDQRREWLT